MNLPTQLALAVVLGGAFAAGVLLVVRCVPRWAAPRLSARIAPYVRDIADPRGLTPLVAVPGLGSLGLGRLPRLDAMLARAGGGAVLSARLTRAGWKLDGAGFRARQLAWALVGLLVGAAAVAALSLAGRMSPAAAILPIVCGACGALLWDAHLTASARRRMARVEDELPMVLEFLALCLAAGEGLRDALRRVGEVGSGELTAEIRRAVLASGTGASLADALADLSRALDVPALARATDQLVAAIERGAPLAGVLQAQAGDAREDAKRRLIEQAGRKEILMLLPLVFLVLPLSVIFAVFPGVVMLRLGVG